MADTTHTCPGGCARRVARSRFACPPCWARLPLDLKRGITGNYGRDVDAHLAAMLDAQRWYRESLLASTPTEETDR